MHTNAWLTYRVMAHREGAMVIYYNTRLLPCKRRITGTYLFSLASEAVYFSRKLQACWPTKYMYSYWVLWTQGPSIQSWDQPTHGLVSMSCKVWRINVDSWSIAVDCFVMSAMASFLSNWTQMSSDHSIESGSQSTKLQSGSNVRQFVQTMDAGCHCGKLASQGVHLGHVWQHTSGLSYTKKSSMQHSVFRLLHTTGRCTCTCTCNFPASNWDTGYYSNWASIRHTIQ